MSAVDPTVTKTIEESKGESRDPLAAIPRTAQAVSLARRTGLGVGLIRKLRKAGLIEGVVVGTNPGRGVLLIYLDSFERFLESRGLRLEKRA